MSSRVSASGFWFEPLSSTRQDALLQLEEGVYRLHIGEKQIRTGNLSELAISDRLGDTPRRLTWPDGGLFETRDNQVIDTWSSQLGHKASRIAILHRLESSWHWVTLALLATVLISYLGIRYGVPAASESIARKLPVPFTEAVSSQALKSLDRFVFEASETDDATQAEVQAQFDQLLAALRDSEVNFRLHFRNMNGIPNAMALPGGDVVVTDDFLDLVEHPEELESVLLHEMGHVLEHHGMTQVIQASAVSVIVTLAFGDLSAMGDLAVGVPVFMLQSSYSRKAETEADDFAFARMQEMGKDPKHFADIILRLSEQELEDGSTEQQGSYFSSHPDSRERARKALEASRALQHQ